MTRTTQQVREAWSPACSGKTAVLLPAYQALDAVMHKHGYRPREGVTGAYNCRHITGGTGYSLHAYGPGPRFTFWTGVTIATAVAVDINWDRNPYGPRLVTDMPRAMVDEICAIRTVDGIQVWRWGGYYSGNKDAMHYEVVASPAELARGIEGHATEEDDMTPEQDDRLKAVEKAVFTKRGDKVYEHLNVIENKLDAILSAKGIETNDDGTVKT